MQAEDNQPSRDSHSPEAAPTRRPESGLIALRRRVDDRPARADARADSGGGEGERVEFEKLVRDIEALEGIVRDWDDQQRGTVRALERALDALHKEALSRLIRELKSEPGALHALKRALSDEVVYGVLRHHGLLRASLHERVELALRSVRPMLEAHGGNVELVEVALPDSVTIRLLGSCDGCPASGLTLAEGVEKAIREHCPEIKSIHQAKGKGLAESSAHYVSPFARATDTGWIPAARLEEVPEADLLVRELAGHSLILSRFEDGVRCYENACAHLGMPLDTATVADGILTCPHHQFQYALESGECLTVPGVQLHTHAVRVVAGSVEVKLS